MFHRILAHPRLAFLLPGLAVVGHVLLHLLQVPHGH